MENNSQISSVLIVLFSGNNDVMVDKISDLIPPLKHALNFNKLPLPNLFNSFFLPYCCAVRWGTLGSRVPTSLIGAHPSVPGQVGCYQLQLNTLNALQKLFLDRGKVFETERPAVDLLLKYGPSPTPDPHLNRSQPELGSFWKKPFTNPGTGSVETVPQEKSPDCCQGIVTKGRRGCFKTAEIRSLKFI